jgi:Domain of unknown function (DUF1989)
MEHSRVAIGHIIPEIGDALVTNRRRLILTLVEDTSGGIHDTLFAARDRWRYEMLGCSEYHDNCTDNLWASLEKLRLEPPETPAPLNLFMNIPVVDGNRVEIRPPISTPGSYISLRAEGAGACDVNPPPRWIQFRLAPDPPIRVDRPPSAGYAPVNGSCARLGTSAKCGAGWFATTRGCHRRCLLESSAGHR